MPEAERYESVVPLLMWCAWWRTFLKEVIYFIVFSMLNAICLEE